MKFRNLKEGDVRFRKIFCWLPYHCFRTTYWLETIYVEERYQSCISSDLHGSELCWIFNAKITKKEYEDRRMRNKRK